MIKIIFAMYNLKPITSRSASMNIHVSFDCKKCNSSVRPNKPSNIAYLTKLARKVLEPYAKLATRDSGLQGYVKAMGEFN